MPIPKKGEKGKAKKPAAKNVTPAAQKPAAASKPNAKKP